MDFLCDFVTGWPLPKLTWYTKSVDDSNSAVDNVVDSLNQVSSKLSKGTPAEKLLDMESSIKIPVLTRDYFGKSYRCEADNNNATTPASTNITIDMRRK